MGIKKQIYFRNMDAYEFLMTQPNHSQYVERLVIADMEGQERLTKNDVIQLIRQYTNAGTHDTGVKNSIKSLLNL